jgi:tRNA pseudouridine38-40 synthase
MLARTFNYLIKIEYDGTYFVGWQYQKNGVSVQEKIEKALSKIFKSKIKINGAGRTDKGVHALGQYANFKINKKIESEKIFLNSINFFLKKNLISITKIKKKNLPFHSRYNAKERIYFYKIINRVGSLSLNKNKAWHIKKKLNIELLKKGAKLLQGTHDFSTYRASSCTSSSPVKKMNAVQIKKKGDEIIIEFKSRSFLQNQVRSMVGSLKYLSSGKWTLNNFKKVFKSKKRSECAPPAPACGLYLKNVKY